MCALSHFSPVPLFATLWTPGSPPGSSVHGILQAKIDCQALLQGIIPTQGWKLHLLCLLHCRQILYLLSHQGKTIYMCVYIHMCIHMYIGLCLLRALHTDANLIRTNCKVITINQFLLLICVEGNGNPLQNSYLENSMDRGAWWAAVHGVTQSDTNIHTHITHQIVYWCCS